MPPVRCASVQRQHRSVESPRLEGPGAGGATLSHGKNPPQNLALLEGKSFNMIDLNDLLHFIPSKLGI